MDNVVLIVGGDMRQLYVSGLMAKDNVVYIMGFDSGLAIPDDVNDIRSVTDMPCKPDIIVFPVLSSIDNEHVNMPFSNSSLRIEDVLDAAKKSTLILAGMPCETLVDLCKRKNLRLIDYFDREELAVLNAVPTVFDRIQWSYTV